MELSSLAMASLAAHQPCAPPARHHSFTHYRSRSVPRFINCRNASQPTPLSDHQAQASFSMIQKAGVIACVRARSAELALDMARAALDGGLDVLEVTMTTPDATKVINKLVQEYPTALLGAGTVLSPMEADLAKAAGAKFLMSPVALKELIAAHQYGPTLFIPGAITPNEVLYAYNWGAMVVKLYPVALMGGIQLVQSLRKSLHRIPLIASQGITAETFDQYIAAGATAVVLSDAIFVKTLVDGKEFKKIKDRAHLIAEKGALFLGT